MFRFFHSKLFQNVSRTDSLCQLLSSISPTSPCVNSHFLAIISFISGISEIDLENSVNARDLLSNSTFRELLMKHPLWVQLFTKESHFNSQSFKRFLNIFTILLPGSEHVVDQFISNILVNIFNLSLQDLLYQSHPNTSNHHIMNPVQKFLLDKLKSRFLTDYNKCLFTILHHFGYNNINNFLKDSDSIFR